MQRLRELTFSPDTTMARAATLVSAMPPLDTSRMSPRSPPDSQEEVATRVSRSAMNGAGAQSPAPHAADPTISIE
jgi:hypothetical protein